MKVILIFLAVFIAGYYLFSSNEERESVKEKEEEIRLIEKQKEEIFFKEKYEGMTIDFINSLEANFIDHRSNDDTKSYYASPYQYTYIRQKKAEEHFPKNKTHLFMIDGGYFNGIEDYYKNDSGKFIIYTDSILGSYIYEFEFDDDVISYLEDLDIFKDSKVYLLGKLNNIYLSRELSLSSYEEEIEIEKIRTPVLKTKLSFLAEKIILSNETIFDYHFDLRFNKEKFKDLER